MRLVHTTTAEKFEKGVVFSLGKRIKCFHQLRRGNLKTQLSLVNLDLCLRKTQRNHKFKVFSVHNRAKPAFSNSCGLKSVIEKLRFRDGLEWKVGLAGEYNCVFTLIPACVVRHEYKLKTIEEEERSRGEFLPHKKVSICESASKTCMSL